MKKYKGVVFDMDGTLLDTLEDMQYSVNIAMKEYGFELHTLEDIRHFITDLSNFACPKINATKRP